MGHTTTWEKDGVYWNIYGILDSAETLSFNEELSDNSRLNELKYFIWDSIDVVEFLIDEDDATLASIFAKLSTQYNVKIKGAFIVKDNYIKKLAHEYIENSERLGSSWKFKTFDNIEDARKWIIT